MTKDQLEVSQELGNRNSLSFSVGSSDDPSFLITPDSNTTADVSAANQLTIDKEKQIPDVNTSKTRLKATATTITSQPTTTTAQNISSFTLAPPPPHFSSGLVSNGDSSQTYESSSSSFVLMEDDNDDNGEEDDDDDDEGIKDLQEDPRWDFLLTTRQITRSGDVTKEWKAMVKHFFDSDVAGCSNNTATYHHGVQKTASSGSEGESFSSSSSQEGVVSIFANDGLYCIVRYYCQLYERLARVGYQFLMDRQKA